jgi:hypothetical protein
MSLRVENVLEHLLPSNHWGSGGFYGYAPHTTNVFHHLFSGEIATH